VVIGAAVLIEGDDQQCLLPLFTVRGQRRVDVVDEGLAGTHPRRWMIVVALLAWEPTAVEPGPVVLPKAVAPFRFEVGEIRKLALTRLR
jgi:hypothetical protein